VATPIEQLVEILPWNDNTAMLGGSYGSPGLVMTRGRAIPAFSLTALLGQPELDRTETASVLVVDSHGEQVGFTVSKLINIDSARWAPSENADCQAAGAKFFERWEPISLLDLQKLAAFM
jgi:purine-binding chemotaxis protein CheW